MQIWSIIYSLHIENVKILKRCLYWNVFITDIYRKIYFNSSLLFQLYLLVSKLHELSQKIQQFFSDMHGN